MYTKAKHDVFYCKKCGKIVAVVDYYDYKFVYKDEIIDRRDMKFICSECEHKDYDIGWRYDENEVDRRRNKIS